MDIRTQPTKQSKVGAAAAKTIADCVVTGPCAAAVVEQCSFCRWRPCFMDRDENYESMLVLGLPIGRPAKTIQQHPLVSYK